MTSTPRPTRAPQALLSVHDKTGLVAFARELAARGWGLVASGGTAKALADAGLVVRAVEDLTGFPELLGGRVKTLHPAVHAGILSRRSEADDAELAARGIGAIDLVAVSLYPFEAALADGADAARLVEEIDIGGVTLLRAAAKAHAHVMVVPGHAYYDRVLAALDADDAARATTRRELAGRTFVLTAAYDRAIAGWLGGEGSDGSVVPVEPPQRASASEALRYGENPHQAGTFVPGANGVPWVQHAGKELSYNNLLDLDAAWCAVAEQRALGAAKTSCVVVKHGSPSGIARADAPHEAVALAIGADPVSAFGGIVALDGQLDRMAVDALGELFLEVVAAPAATDDALFTLRMKKKNCRVLTLPLDVGTAAVPRARTVLGGTLIHAPDLLVPDAAERASWRVVTSAVPDAATLERLAFAWLACKHVKSNAIVLAQRVEGASGPLGVVSDTLVTVGIGGGQTNRIDAVRQACERAGGRARGAVLASDAFFPFADGLEVAAAAGVAAVVQPGGALRDQDVIAAADRLGLAMVFTGRRHFRH